MISVTEEVLRALFSKLTRYDDCTVKFFGPNNNVARIENPTPGGKYVKFEDVEAIIKEMFIKRGGIK